MQSGAQRHGDETHQVWSASEAPGEPFLDAKCTRRVGGVGRVGVIVVDWFGKSASLSRSQIHAPSGSMTRRITDPA
jgi:hypothetical protein